MKLWSLVFTCICLFSYINVNAQYFNRPIYDTTSTPGIRFTTELGALVSSNSRTPFWLRANQFGTIPLESPGGIFLLGGSGIWGDVKQNKRPYFKASIQAVGNANRNSRFILPEAYASISLGHAELYIGRRKEISGITDTLLTSGSYALSGNAVPITQIRIGTKDYVPLKFTKGLFSVNAFFSHGRFTDTDSLQNVYLHAKALYVRIGKPNWKIRLYGGMSHYVQWGGYSKYLGPGYAVNGHIASDWRAYKKALWPSSVEDDERYTRFDTANRSGNHLGSIDIALELYLPKAKMLFYVQRPWEDMSGVVFGNLPDGLYGARWQNLRTSSGGSFKFDQLTVEFMSTMDQSGPKLPKGNDDYFVNYQYLDGWSHQRRVIGTPFFTRRGEALTKWNSLRGGFNNVTSISNNRMQLIHIGAYGKFKSGTSIRGLLSYSWNYGRPARPLPVFAIKQFSGLIEVNVPTKFKGLECKASLALDKGDWLPSSLGGILSIRKTGWF